MGKQIIVPESTSYMEYLDSDKAFMIPCIEDKINIQEAPLIRIYQDSFWDVPDVNVASKYISEIDTLPLRDAQKHVVENYSWDIAAQHLSETLTNIEIDSKAVNGCDHSHFKEDIQLVVCRTLGTPCGIAEYTKSLHMVSNKSNKKLVTIGGDCFDTLVKVDKYRVHSVHIQNEYQFYSLERLQFMVKRMKEKRLYLTLTQHTFNENAYQYNNFFIENFNMIITHNKDVVDMYCKQFGEDCRRRVVYMPMPIERVFDPELKIQFNVYSKDLNFGFFGFCYYHKGLDRLLTAFHNVLFSQKVIDSHFKDMIKLYIFSNKPQQDTMNYYEHCLSLVDALDLNNNVQWMTNYVQIRGLISSLHKLDVIYLPYDHYGSYGSSAALATCIQAEHPRIVCSLDSPYFDVGNIYEPNIVSCWNSNLEQHLQDVVDNYIDCGEKPVTDPAIWNRIFEERNWVDMSEMLLGLGEKHGSLLQCQKD
jgi:hypothetical protein